MDEDVRAILEAQNQKNEELTVKMIGKIILVFGIIIALVLVMFGIFEDDYTNWYIIFGGIFSLLFFTLPIWAVLTMLSNISISLKNQIKKEKKSSGFSV